MVGPSLNAQHLLGYLTKSSPGAPRTFIEYFLKRLRKCFKIIEILLNRYEALPNTPLKNLDPNLGECCEVFCERLATFYAICEYLILLNIGCLLSSASCNCI